MLLELQLDRELVYRTSFPICRADRSSAFSQGEQGKIALWLAPRRAIIWSGYRDTADTSRARQRIEADVWQAGADSAFLTRGVAFMTGKTILMNTLHVARPGAADSTLIAGGLVLVTRPDTTHQ
jgi:hypothetical protein